MDKVIFMPFDPTNPMYMSTTVFEYGPQQRDKSGNLGGHNKNQLTVDHDLAKGNNAFQVWYNGKTNPLLASVSSGQVYIRGHGMPGENIIEGGRGGEKVPYDEVVNRLITSGLRKTFAGKIKCYNCHSAETIDPTDKISYSIIQTDGQAFAQLIADEMYARGYKHCTFYGYVGAIDSQPKDGSEGKHKYVRVKIIKNGKMIQEELGRASESRFEFYPNPIPKKKNFFKNLFS
jgi:hypothetical protein